MKEIDFTDKILQYKEKGLLADEKAGYPPNCKPGHELSKDKKKCVPIKEFSDEAKTKEQYEKIDTKELSEIINENVELDMEVYDDDCGWKYSYKII